MRTLALLALAAAGLGLVAGGSSAGRGARAAAPGTIVVTGDASVSTVPDRAEFSFGVSTGAPTASAALRANAVALTSVLAALRGKGIAGADLRTELVSLAPRYSDNGARVLGYRASDSVDVTLRDLAAAGAVVDAAVAAGANEVSGPDLAASDRDSLYRRALRAAVADARAKAETIASAAGLRVVGVANVEENTGQPGPLLAQAAASAPTPIEPGTQAVAAAVEVTFVVG